MESDLGTVAVKELQSVVREIQRHGIRNNAGNWIVAFHFAFGGVSIAAWLVVLCCKIAGYQLGDELVSQYLFSLATSVMLFAVGTLMIEQMRGDLPAAVLGRMLAGCGLFVMSAQGYEFMQKSRLCEFNMELMAKQHSAKDVADPAMFFREITSKNLTVSFESKDDGNGWGRPVLSGGRCSLRGDDRPSSESRGADSLLRRTPAGAGNATNGTSAVY